MTPPFRPTREIADTLAASARYVIADAHYILAQGRCEQPAVFADLTCDTLIHFVGRVRDDWIRGATPALSEQDAAVARQILRRLAFWSPARQVEAAAWELALGPFPIALPAVRRGA